MNAISPNAALANYADMIRDYHLSDRKRRIERSLAASLTAALLVVLGSACFLG